MDVKSINLPDFSRDLNGEDWYVYSAFLKPGYHKLLIYDPKLERAFCKDFIINVNSRKDVYPEHPRKE